MARKLLDIASPNSRIALANAIVSETFVCQPSGDGCTNIERFAERGTLSIVGYRTIQFNTMYSIEYSLCVPNTDGQVRNAALDRIDAFAKIGISIPCSAT